MMLREEIRERLLADRGICVKEGCDKGGQLLGPVRYTRKNESAGVCCSCECRGDAERPVVRQGGRPRQHKSNAARQRAYRSRILSVTKPCSLAETKDLQAQKTPLSYHPLTGALGGPTAA